MKFKQGSNNYNRMNIVIAKIGFLMFLILVVTFCVFKYINIRQNNKNDYSSLEEESLFDTKRLLVKKSEEEELDFGENSRIISKYGDMYLVEYDTKKDTEINYNHLKELGSLVVESDIEISIADDVENKSATSIKYDTNDNPLNNIPEYNIENINSSEDYLIALIDTGATKNENVVERVSVIGDIVEDDNGHGDKMVNYILSQEIDAKILSIKALDSNGKGTVSSIYAAIEYAISRGVRVINLSVSAYNSGENSILESEIFKASENGILVVGAAGNNGSDASYYIPGKIYPAIIVGSCDEEGKTKTFSNMASSVDYNLVSDSTSEACSLMTGYISKNKLHYGNVNSYIKSDENNSLIFEIENKEEKNGIINGKNTEFEINTLAEIDQTIEYKYTGTPQIFTASVSGDYFLEVAGGKGGKRGSAAGGKGAYASGTYHMNAGDTIYIIVGQQGTVSTGQPCGEYDITDTQPTAQAYNGGGWGGFGSSNEGHTGSGGSGGGGMTHIATIASVALSKNKYTNGVNVSSGGTWDPTGLIIAAGGGGGAAYERAGGYGGIDSGRKSVTSIVNNNKTTYALPGTQISGNAQGAGGKGGISGPGFLDGNEGRIGGGGGGRRLLGRIWWPR